MKTGIFATSSKKNERRIPIHPNFFRLIDSSIKKKLFFEKGYAKEYGYNDSYFIENFGGVYSREDLFYNTDLWILPKPSKDDFKYFSNNKILFGWAHCVQDREIVEVLVKNKMTVITWESMYSEFDNTHIFQSNNEIAGYAAVHHFMSLVGRSGYFGNSLKIAVLGFGSTSRGAIHGLRTLGYNDISVFTKRENHLINAPIPGIKYFNMKHDNSNTLLNYNENFIPSSQHLKNYDVIVNCVLQDPINPMMFINKEDLQNSIGQKFIIDVSCDEAMGFDFAIPTSFDNSVVQMDNILYYSVDHTPSYYYDAASYEITKSVLPYLKKMILGEFESCNVLKNATEIKNGNILNEKIIKFQGLSK